MSMVSPQLGAIAGQLGESPDAVQKGLQGGLATVLTSIGNKASDTSFLQQLLGLVKSPVIDATTTPDLGAMISGGVNSPMKDLASQFLSMIFGSSDKQSTISNLIGQASGLKGSSAASLLGMVAPLLLSYFGKQAGSLNAASLGSMISGELPSLARFLPAGLGTILGGASLPHTVHTPPVNIDQPKSGGGGWVLPVLIGLLALGGLFWYLFRGQEPAAQPVEKAATAVVEAPKGLWAALGNFFKRKLPDGTELSIPELGVENKLIAFIEDNTKMVDKETWFDFDRLLFDTGKATLKPESQAQLKDIAAILKAYPKVHVRLGGYTDNVGDKAANVKLSQERAANVEHELTQLGIASARLDSKGYGEEHPVASNDSEEGRAKNRRISLRVTEK